MERHPSSVRRHAVGAAVAEPWLKAARPLPSTAACRKLTGMDVVAAFAFLLRRHPLSAGMTPLESLLEGSHYAMLDLTDAFVID